MLKWSHDCAHLFMVFCPYSHPNHVHLQGRDSEGVFMTLRAQPYLQQFAALVAQQFSTAPKQGSWFWKQLSTCEFQQSKFQWMSSCRLFHGVSHLWAQIVSNNQHLSASGGKTSWRVKWSHVSCFAGVWRNKHSADRMPYDLPGILCYHPQPLPPSYLGTAVYLWVSAVYMSMDVFMPTFSRRFPLVSTACFKQSAPESIWRKKQAEERTGVIFIYIYILYTMLLYIIIYIIYIYLECIYIYIFAYVHIYIYICIFTVYIHRCFLAKSCSKMRNHRGCDVFLQMWKRWRKL